MLARPSAGQLALAGALIAMGFGMVLGSRTPPHDPLPRRAPATLVEHVLTRNPVPLPDSAVAAAEKYLRGRVDVEAFTGFALALGNRSLIQKVAGYGTVAWDTASPLVTVDRTWFDLASLTKVVATTAAVMALVEDGRLVLDAPVQRYVPEFAGRRKDQVTVRQLLTHTGGTRAGMERVDGETRGAVRRYLLSLPLALVPGEHVLYSDIGFVVLWEVAERAAGEPLEGYLRRRVWEPLGMSSTKMGVPSPCAACAPTLHLAERDGPYSGGSYDKIGRRMDGRTGNAGAFSTAHDLARFAAMIANDGRLEDVRIFRRATVRAFTRPQRDSGTRALGWEVYCREGVVPDSRACKEVWAVGHTGVTGTSLWIDPSNGNWLVLLTNRTYLPRLDVDMQKLRRRVFDRISPREVE